MTDSNIDPRFLEVFPQWLRSLGEDAGGVGEAVAAGGNDDATRALVKKQLEDAFTQAAHDAIMQNRRAIPGIDLAQAMALPDSLIVQ